jgi:hypothetical protein
LRSIDYIDSDIEDNSRGATGLLGLQAWVPLLSRFALTLWKSTRPSWGHLPIMGIDGGSAGACAKYVAGQTSGNVLGRGRPTVTEKAGPRSPFQRGPPPRRQVAQGSLAAVPSHVLGSAFISLLCLLSRSYFFLPLEDIAMAQRLRHDPSWSLVWFS